MRAKREFIKEGAKAGKELILKYYEHRFEEGGVIRYDSYYEKTPALYKKSDIENVGPLIFEYEVVTEAAQKGSPHNEGYAKLGSSSVLEPYLVNAEALLYC